MKVHYSSKSYEWSTPQDLFDKLDKEFNFTLDPCATHENAKCKKYYTKEDNGLMQPWIDERVFMNPPYGRVISQWIRKAYNASLVCPVIVGLLPARTDTKYFHEYIYHKAEIRFLKGRIKFGGFTTSAPFPSMVVIWKPHYERMKA